MIAKVLTAAINGLESVLIEVEVDLPGRGLPSYSIVGLPDKAIDEARERTKSAIRNSGFDFPNEKIVINLAPSDLPKDGTSFDLALAVGILKAKKELPEIQVNNKLFIGELSLTGDLKSVSGVLAMLFLVKKEKIEEIYVPKDNACEANIIASLFNKTSADRKIRVFGVASLKELVFHLKNLVPIETCQEIQINLEDININPEIDFADIRGQEFAKRGMEIAAAGNHNVSLTGSPGSGKTMLARALVSILPSLSLKEAIEVTKIYSICGKLDRSKPLVDVRPFRSPHHVISQVGLIGGGTNPKPGEISLAHRGVLFLDEFPQFPKNCIEALRAPIEDGSVTISRANSSITFPTSFLLVTSQNPCPCGFFGDPEKVCHCTPAQIANYQKRISGPVWDRIDLHINVPRVAYDKLTNQAYAGEKSLTIKQRVQKAREIQKDRFKNSVCLNNSEMKQGEIKKFCNLDIVGEKLVKEAVVKLSLSARSYFRVLKVARTIADLDRSENIKSFHLAEALQFRHKE